MSYIISAIIILITAFTIVIVNSFDDVVVIQNHIAEESEEQVDEYEDDPSIEVEIPQEPAKLVELEKIEPVEVDTAKVESAPEINRTGLIERQVDNDQVTKTNDELIVKASKKLPDIKTLVLNDSESNQTDTVIIEPQRPETAPLRGSDAPEKHMVATQAATPVEPEVLIVSETLNKPAVPVQPATPVNQVASSKPVHTDGSKIMIKWPTKNQRWHSDDSSYKALFELWGLDYNKVEHGSPCSFAKDQGFKCHRDQYGIKSLRELNRPAVLTLYDEYDQLEYVMIKSLDGNEAKLVIAGNEQIVPVSQLMAHWKGEFSIIWQIPDGYFQPIVPGDSGRAVLWLNKRMLDIKHRPGIIPHNYYDDSLLEQVKSFQLKQGLEADGVIGIRTLIHINQAINQKIPILESS